MTGVPFPLAPFRGDEELPAQAGTVIIGGGIIGILTALELAEAGEEVVVLEKGVVAGEQSSRNWGWVRQMGRAEAELPLARYALEEWRSMAGRIGRDVGFRQTGIVYTAFGAADAAHWRQWHEIGKRHGVTTELWSPEETRARLNGMAKPALISLYSPQDGCAEPWQAVPAMAEAARAKGVRILTGCAARCLDLQGGTLRGVITERGRIKARRVLVAAGAWTRTFLRSHGVTFKSLPLIGTVARAEGVTGLPDHPFGTENFSFRPRQDGGHTLTLRNANVARIQPDSFRFFTSYLAHLKTNWREFHLRIGTDFLTALMNASAVPPDRPGIFEQTRVLNPAPSQLFLRRSLDYGRAAFPQFGTARISHIWGGCMDITPDAVPVVDHVPDLPGVFVASGASGHGFGLGPGLARLTSDLILGRAPVVDPTPFRWGR